MKLLLGKVPENKLFCWIFAFLLFTAEIILTFGDIFISFIIYLFLFILLLVIAYLKYQQSSCSLYLSMTLIPLIRITNVSIPLSGLPEVFKFGVISVPLFITGAIAAKMIGLSFTNLGFSFDRLHHKLLISLLGIPLGFVKLFILQHGKFNISVTPEGILIWVLILIISVGLLEEFLFRGILYNVFFRVLGFKTAVYFTSILYATLTIPTKSFLNVICAFSISVIFCLLYTKGKSLISLSLAHGLINIILFLYLPNRLTETFSRGDAPSVFTIDLIIFFVLIGLLIAQEFLKLNFNQCWLFKTDTALNKGSIIFLGIIPFLYIFIYVLLYKTLQLLM